MYSKLDIIQIFFNCKNLDEFQAVQHAFAYLIDENYMCGSIFLYKVSMIALDKL